MDTGLRRYDGGGFYCFHVSLCRIYHIPNHDNGLTEPMNYFMGQQWF